MSEHTKTPWKWMGHVIYMGSPGSCDAETGEPLCGGFSLQHCPNAEANARHIVHCVNNHERLARMVERLTDECELHDVPAGIMEEARALLAALEAEKGGEL